MLSVDADLRVATPAGDLQVFGRGSTVWVRMDSARAARHVVNLLAPDRGRRERLLGWLSRGLSYAGLDLRVEIAGRLVGTLGPSMRSNQAARLTGLRPVRIHPVSLLRALLGPPWRPSSLETQ